MLKDNGVEHLVIVDDIVDTEPDTAGTMRDSIRYWYISVEECCRSKVEDICSKLGWISMNCELLNVYPIQEVLTYSIPQICTRHWQAYYDMAGAETQNG
jgi:hypothetical protein